MNNRFKPIDEEITRKPKTLADIIDPEMKEQMGDTPPILLELNMWYEFYSQKFLEKEDRKDIESMVHRAGKLFVVSLLIGGVANRMLTNLKLFGKDFLNLKLFIRLPIRFFIFSMSFSGICLVPMTDHLINLYDKINNKYVERFIRFQKQGDPLIMNPNLLNEEGMSKDEREYITKYNESVRAQFAGMQAQNKRI